MVTNEHRRSRGLGLGVGTGRVGRTNTIVDVTGLRVGHTTITDGRDVFSGATAIVVDGVSPTTPVPAAVFVGNGYGKLVGTTQVNELGRLETPVVLTSTLSVFAAADAIVTWMLREHGRHLRSLNPVAGEINDSWLSWADPRPVTSAHVIAALDVATSDAVAMGNVGGGTGACALGFKGGIGSSSRILEIGGQTTRLGALVQVNMDGLLRVAGRAIVPSDHGSSPAGPAAADGSCMVVIAVDVPLDPNTLRRIAARGVFALARVGARFSHGSGDYGLAFSTRAGEAPIGLSDAESSALFEAGMDAVEEAVIDALLAATSVESGNGHRAMALPVEALGGHRETDGRG